ncbi:serine carboxypeptidase-like 15 [Arachis duranensis]|uniref:Serine carboxypeptidase-like 15 n=1 Tax=Arachis duranensis TaxID=130453 RepID=A0A9C6WTC4_ARADU|nr:serine carboxypeptidase-like 15 [Arachis duranensis]
MASNNQVLLLAFTLTLTLFLQLLPSQIEGIGAKVENLPGYDGPLPFHLETGYIGLGDSDDEMQAFYYFIKSENDPKNDPLLLWLTGGPGCSSFSGLVYQIGPMKFKIEEFDGSLPKLIPRPQSWTKVANIIFVDLPMGTGFSYAKNVLPHRSDWKFVHQTHRFIRKWLAENPIADGNELLIINVYDAYVLESIANIFMPPKFCKIWVLFLLYKV